MDGTTEHVMNNNHSNHPDDKNPQDKAANDTVVDERSADKPSDQSAERAKDETDSRTESAQV